MLFYGGRSEQVETRAALLELARTWRHRGGVDFLVGAGALAQGLIDAEFEQNGRDEDTPLHRAAMAMVLAAARTLTGGLADEAALCRLTRLQLPKRLALRVPEGFAHYAVDPRCYALAAERHWPTGLHAAVIGLRSIGTGLAAAVAAHLPAPVACLTTVRPVGHPFARELSVGEGLARRWLESPNLHFAIVDEGPGLSGSSFGAVGDWLEAHGVAASRLHFFPSHGGPPGPQARAVQRQRWDRSARHVVPFEEVFRDPLGRTPAALCDVGAGQWRQHLLPHGDWPAVNTQSEKRKYVHGRALLKFVGFGAYGERVAALAHTAAAAGFAPAVGDLHAGFLEMAWHSGARPLAACPDYPRRTVVARLTDYLDFLSVGPHLASGASLAELSAMAVHNTGEALGEDAATAVLELVPKGFSPRPVASDNKQQAWEWIVLPNGSLLKTDGAEHHLGHDLIGPQDIAWDVAGASIELGLSAKESSEVAHRFARAHVLRFYRVCHLAFELGRATLGEQAMKPVSPGDARRFAAAGARYRLLLLAELKRDAACEPGRAGFEPTRVS